VAEATVEIPAAPAAEIPVEIPPEMDIDPVMAAMIAAGDAPMPEMPAPEIPVPEAAETVPGSEGENLDAMLNAEVDALTQGAPESEILVVMPTEQLETEEAPVPEEPVMDAEAALNEEIPIEEMALTEEPIPEDIPIQETALSEDIPAIEETEQIPAELDMAQATDALSGAVEDIEAFLNSDDYEYTKVITSANTVIIIKTQDGSSMAVIYEDGEFQSLESGYSKDGKTSYSDIMNDFVKEIIKTGGNTSICRHKGTKVVAK
jgi:hypothetical protein